MPVFDFYNVNANIAYPFTEDSVDDKSGSPYIEALPDYVIVDAGFITGVDSGFDVLTDTIWLHEIERTDASTVAFKFRSSASGLSGQTLTFTRDVTDDPYTIEYQEITAKVQSGASCVAVPLFTGFLVTGDMSRIADLVPNVSDTYTRNATGGIIEHSLVQNMKSSYVTSINLANDDRTRVTAPSGCQSVQWPFTVEDLYINSQCLVGDVEVTSGYNVSVFQVSTDNKLLFGASPGAGEGEVCDEVQLFDSEAAPTGSDLLTGGPSCFDAIRTINGISGATQEIFVGLGVSITPKPDEHKLVLNVDMTGLKLCVDESDNV